MPTKSRVATLPILPLHGCSPPRRPTHRRTKAHTSPGPLLPQLAGVPTRLAVRERRPAYGPGDRLPSASAAAARAADDPFLRPAAVEIAIYPALATPFGPSGVSVPEHRRELTSICRGSFEHRPADRAARRCRQRLSTSNNYPHVAPHARRHDHRPAEKNGTREAPSSPGESQPLFVLRTALAPEPRPATRARAPFS